MANKQKATFEIKLESLDGRRLKVRYDNNALAELEDVYGKTMPEIFEDLAASHVGYKFTRALVWAGLLTNNMKGLTLKKVGNILSAESDESSGEILGVCLRAFMAAHGIDPDKVEKEEEAASDGLAPLELAPQAAESKGNASGTGTSIE